MNSVGAYDTTRAPAVSSSAATGIRISRIRGSSTCAAARAARRPTATTARVCRRRVLRRDGVRQRARRATWPRAPGLAAPSPNATDPDSCAGASSCDVHGACKPAAVGQACAQPSDCASGFCADGVCCNSACTVACSACTAALTGGASGTCADVQSGMKHGADCPDDGMLSCQRDGTCDGAQGCRLYGKGTSCGQSECEGTRAVGRVCDGLGKCGDSADGDECSPFACSSALGGCASPCTATSDCVPGNYCASGACKPALAPGVALHERRAACPGSAPFCVDGVCCNTPCHGQCEALRTLPPRRRGSASPVSGAPPRRARRMRGVDGAASAMPRAATAPRATRARGTRGFDPVPLTVVHRRHRHARGQLQRQGRLPGPRDRRPARRTAATRAARPAVLKAWRVGRGLQRALPVQRRDRHLRSRATAPRATVHAHAHRAQRHDEPTARRTRAPDRPARSTARRSTTASSRPSAPPTASASRRRSRSTRTRRRAVAAA